MDEIKPALAAEEWRGPTTIERPDAEINAKTRGDGTKRLYVKVRWHPIDDPDTLQALAALALHGQPFGFTREMVAKLRAVAERERTERSGVPGYPSGPGSGYLPGVFLDMIAARIEALLPPAGESDVLKFLDAPTADRDTEEGQG